MSAARKERLQEALSQKQEKKEAGIGDRLLGHIKENAKEELKGAADFFKNFRAGDGHLGAMGRLGLKELRNAMNPAQGSVADNEIGLYGTKTQGEIATAREDTGLDAEQEKKKSTEPGKLTLASMRQDAAAKEAEQPDHGLAHQQEQERGMDR